VAAWSPSWIRRAGAGGAAGAATAAIKVIVIDGVAQTLQRGMVVDGGLTNASQTAQRRGKVVN
jgi:hypothetical protein